MVNLVKCGAQARDVITDSMQDVENFEAEEVAPTGFFSGGYIDILQLECGANEQCRAGEWTK